MRLLLLSIIIAVFAVPVAQAQRAAEASPLVVHYSANEAKTVTIRSAGASAVLKVPVGTFMQITEEGSHGTADYARFDHGPHVYRGEVTISILPEARVEGALAPAFEQPATKLVLHDAEVTVATSKQGGA